MVVWVHIAKPCYNLKLLKSQNHCCKNGTPSTVLALPVMLPCLPLQHPHAPPSFLDNTYQVTSLALKNNLGILGSKPEQLRILRLRKRLGIFITRSVYHEKMS